MSKNIVVPLDGSSLANAALPHAVELARRTSAALHLVRVHIPIAPVIADMTPLVLPDPRIEEEVTATQRAWLDARAKEIARETHLAVRADFRTGEPGAEIVAAAEACDADFIVCTTHGAGGWAPSWFGSVTDYVLRHTVRPVLAMSSVAAERTVKPASILVLLDGSPRSLGILPEVKAFARAYQARVELYRVIVPPWVGESEVALAPDLDRFGVTAYAAEAKQELAAIATELRASGLTVTSMVEIHNGPARRILQHIELANPDLIALATHGRGLSRLFLGSVADKVLRASARPMLCVRPLPVSAGEAIRRFEASMARSATTIPA